MSFIDQVSSTNSSSNLRVKQEDEETNKLAERALLRLKEKLKGNLDGTSLSVSGQVNMLIQQATDPYLLCQLFAGWQPYL